MAPKMCMKSTLISTFVSKIAYIQHSFCELFSPFLIACSNGTTNLFIFNYKCTNLHDACVRRVANVKALVQTSTSIFSRILGLIVKNPSGLHQCILPLWRIPYSLSVHCIFICWEPLIQTTSHSTLHIPESWAIHLPPSTECPVVDVIRTHTPKCWDSSL